MSELKYTGHVTDAGEIKLPRRLRKAVFEKAKEIAANEVAREAGEHSNIFAYRHALRLLEEGHTVESRAISVAKKLVVWQHFFESKNQVNERRK